MRRRNLFEDKQPLVMIIPMIDIMLFLLVFFMLGTIYMVQTNNFNVDLPQSSGERLEIQPKVLSITVTESGAIMYEGEKILIKHLPQVVTHALTKDNETVFVIYGDKSARYEKVVNVLEVLKKSGARHVSVATELKN